MSCLDSNKDLPNIVICNRMYSAMTDGQRLDSGCEHKLILYSICKQCHKFIKADLSIHCVVLHIISMEIIFSICLIPKKNTVQSGPMFELVYKYLVYLLWKISWQPEKEKYTSLTYHLVIVGSNSAHFLPVSFYFGSST